MSYEERIEQLKEEFSKTAHKLRIADVEDYCTKCTVKPIVKEHMCDECYIQHNAEIRLFALGKLVGKKFGNLS